MMNKAEKITLVERHVYKPSDPEWAELNAVCHLSNNLYNSTAYFARQEFFKTGKFPSYATLNKIFVRENQQDYRKLPAKVAQQPMMQFGRSANSYLGLEKAYKKGELENKPGLPGYLPKGGRNVLHYDRQAISVQREGYVRLSGTNVFILTEHEARWVRVVPSRSSKNITVEVGYEVDLPAKVEGGKRASIDIGINNLATLVIMGFGAILFNGRPLKAINQYFNKMLAKLRSDLDLEANRTEVNKKKKGVDTVEAEPVSTDANEQSKGKRGGKRKKKATSKRIKKLFQKRNNKIADYLHKVTREITNQLVSNGVSTLVIGYNKAWKQDVNLGKRTNQNFVQIPFLKFIDQLRYKCALVGIRVVTRDEAYTSKCSFLDNEDICKKDSYGGYRPKRGLYKLKGRNQVINADINAACNILKLHLLEEEAWTEEIHSNLVEVCRVPMTWTVDYNKVNNKGHKLSGCATT